MASVEERPEYYELAEQLLFETLGEEEVKANPEKYNKLHLALGELFSERVGATGKFPDGKVNEADEGEIQFAVGHKNGLVIMQFGKTVKWLAFPPDAADNIARGLITHAIRVREEEKNGKRV